MKYDFEKLVDGSKNGYDKWKGMKDDNGEVDKNIDGV